MIVLEQIFVIDGEAKVAEALAAAVAVAGPLVPVVVPVSKSAGEAGAGDSAAALDAAGSAAYEASMAEFRAEGERKALAHHTLDEEAMETLVINQKIDAVLGEGTGARILHALGD